MKKKKRDTLKAKMKTCIQSMMVESLQPSSNTTISRSQTIDGEQLCRISIISPELKQVKDGEGRLSPSCFLFFNTFSCLA